MKKIGMLVLACFLLALMPMVCAAEAEPLYFDDFEKENGEPWQTSEGLPCFVSVEENSFYAVSGEDYYEKEALSGLRNYAVSFDLLMDYRDEDGNFGTTWPTLRWRASEDSYYNMYFYNKQGAEELGVQKFTKGQETWLATASVPLCADNEKMVPIRISCAGSQIEIYYKDMKKPAIAFSDEENAPGGGAFCWIRNGASAFYLDNLTVEKTDSGKTDQEAAELPENREIYLLRDGESEQEGVIEEDGNHYYDALQGLEYPLEQTEFVCELRFRKDFFPYGEDKPYLYFGDGYRLILDSDLQNGGVILEKEGAELAKAELWLADFDACWMQIGLCVSAEEIVVCFADEELLRYSLPVPIGQGVIGVLGGDVDDWFVSATEEDFPLCFSELLTESLQGEKILSGKIRSRRIGAQTATAIFAVHQNGILQGMTAEESQTENCPFGTATGKERNWNSALPELADAQYSCFLWDESLRPMAEFASDGIPQPTKSGKMSEETFSVSAGTDGENMIVSGTTDCAAVSVLICPKGEENAPNFAAVEAIRQIAAESDRFSEIFSFSEAEEGDYLIFAASERSPFVCAEAEYLKPANLEGYLSDLNSCADADTLCALLRNADKLRYARRFSIDAEAFADLEQNMQNGVCERILASKSGAWTAETVGEAFTPQIVYALCKAAENASALQNVLEEKTELLALCEGYRNASGDVRRESCDSLRQNLKKGTYDDLSQLLDGAEEMTVLAAIFKANYKDIPELLKQQKTLLGIDMTKLQSLSVTEQTAAYRLMNQKKCLSRAEFCQLFDSAIQKAKQKEEPRGGGGGGGGTSSVIRTPAEPVEKEPEQPEQKTEKTVYYTDLAETHWAWQAVSALSLADPPILSGYADGSFAPDRSVTRAEFIKMLLHTFYPNMAGEVCTYADAEQDAWYYPFMAAAEKEKLVQGTEDGRCLPNEKISRQDMAVLLYRVAERKLIPLGQKNARSFSDEAEISDYAKQAVDALSAAEIINGTDDGAFCPLGAATRAQAAKMLYELKNR